ncbi:MAG: hypothetical protein ACTSVY_09290 [Candidatus Helarchaeota archaeon]
MQDKINNEKKEVEARKQNTCPTFSNTLAFINEQLKKTNAKVKSKKVNE